MKTYFMQAELLVKADSPEEAIKIGNAMLSAAAETENILDYWPIEEAVEQPNLEELTYET